MDSTGERQEIYLAGGCFWGTEHYFKKVKGIIETEVGYANGSTENPSYEQVCHQNTGHAETVKIIYIKSEISLEFILELYYEVIDPTSINRQGGDTGTQYRTGIYYVEKEDLEIIKKSIAHLQEKYKELIQIEVSPLLQYKKAEEYHQQYLIKHPHGYCHIGMDKMNQAEIANGIKGKDNR